MNSTLVMIGFALSVLMGAGLVALLATLRPQWSARSRGFVAASVLPVVTLIATALGVFYIKAGNHDASDQMKDLAVSAMVTIGVGFTALSFIGGLIGATLAGRRYR